jgi:hypothetical protein
MSARMVRGRVAAEGDCRGADCKMEAPRRGVDDQRLGFHGVGVNLATSLSTGDDVAEP